MPPRVRHWSIVPILLLLAAVLTTAVADSAQTLGMGDNVMAAVPVKGEAFIKPLPRVNGSEQPKLSGTATFERYPSSMGAMVVLRVTGLPDTNPHWWDIQFGTCDSDTAQPPMGGMVAESGRNKRLEAANSEQTVTVTAVFPNAYLTPGKAKYLAIYRGAEKATKGPVIACGNIASIDPDILRMEIPAIPNSLAVSYAHWKLVSRQQPDGSVERRALIELRLRAFRHNNPTLDRDGSYPWLIHRGACASPGPAVPPYPRPMQVSWKATSLLRHDITLDSAEAMQPVPRLSIVVYKKDLDKTKRDMATWDPVADRAACGDGLVIPRYSW